MGLLMQMAGQVALFSYGTLRQPEVQLATYGRLVETEADALTGHVLTEIVVDDPHVVSVSGKTIHTIAQPTRNAEDRIEGAVLFLTEEELRAIDDYETDAYARTEVALESGRRAFVYVDASTVAR